jgi:peroxiredoxin family protein
LSVEVCSNPAVSRADTPERPNGLVILVFSGDFDRVQAALMMAIGAAASGFPVTLFFSFWGLSALRRKSLFGGKSFLEKMVTAMLPGGIHRLPTSRMNFLGAGPRLFKTLMRRKGVPHPAEMLEQARELGVCFVACSTSMDVMGISADELLPDVQAGGVASFLGEAARSSVQLVF